MHQSLIRKYRQGAKDFAVKSQAWWTFERAFYTTTGRFLPKPVAVSKACAS
jgi:hypothetical protein